MNKLTISIILSILITAIVIGGGVYLYQKNIFKKEKQQLQSQIDDLNNQIMRLTTGNVQDTNSLNEINGNKCTFRFTDAFWITIQSNQKVTDRVVEKVVEQVVENLSENQKQIIELVRRDNYITAYEIAKRIDISHRKVQENMAKLKEMGILKRIGPAKGGHWEVVQK